MKSTGKGIKRTKNQPVFYEELKKRRNIMVTNTAWENLIKASNSLEISVSELIERVGRNMYGDIKKDDCD
ncbi:MAG: hypothetical protein HEQ26_08595 [Dolichospermum sp. DL01]|jgi:hypothetical protein|nr:MAG: hypothetical protein HEQ26_08595 [Dolichospermum sp. DL01]